MYVYYMKLKFSAEDESRKGWRPEPLLFARRSSHPSYVVIGLQGIVGLLGLVGVRIFRHGGQLRFQPNARFHR